MKVLVVRNNSNPQARDASLLLAAYFATQGIDYALADSCDLAAPGHPCEVRHLVRQGLDLAVVLGGDGTILRTARQMGCAGVPILGINFGRLGFLANSSDDGVVAIVASALAGDVVAERRANLRIDVVCEGEPDPWEGDGTFDGIARSGEGHREAEEADTRDYGIDLDLDLDLDLDIELDLDLDRGTDPCNTPHTFFALNELAVTRGANGRLIDFELGISDARVAQMRGDGVVVATATGSTGYALSAGGPLVSPGFAGLVVVPIAPHTLHSRSLVTSESDVVDVRLLDNTETAYPREATLFADGEPLKLPAPARHIYIRRGEAPTVLLRYQREDFYEHVAKTFF